MGETNFVSRADTIYILTHVPIMKLSSVVDLYRYEKTPLTIANSSKHIAIDPEESIIAVNNDRSLYLSMTEDELSRCTKLHNKFWCPLNQVTKKTQKKSCVKSLYMKNEEEIRNTCILHTVDPEEFVFQTSDNDFYGYAPKPTELYITCDTTSINVMEKDRDSRMVDGFYIVHMPDSCKGTLPLHIFSTTTDYVTDYNMSPEAFQINFKELFTNVDVDEEDIAQFISGPDNADRKVTVSDVIKQYGIRKLQRSSHASSIMIYVMAGVITVSVVGIGLSAIKRIQAAKEKGRKSQGQTNTYVSLSTMPSSINDIEECGVSPEDNTRPPKQSTKKRHP